MFGNQCDILDFLKYFNQPETQWRDRVSTVLTHPKSKPRHWPCHLVPARIWTHISYSTVSGSSYWSNHLVSLETMEVMNNTASLHVGSLTPPNWIIVFCDLAVLLTTTFHVLDLMPIQCSVTLFFWRISCFGYWPKQEIPVLCIASV